MSLPFSLLEKISELSPREIQERFTLKKNPLEVPYVFMYNTFFEDVKLGEIFFHFDEEENYLCWHKFYPLSTKAAAKLAKGEAYSSKSGYGLGTLAHVTALSRILQEIPSLHQGFIRHLTYPSEGRIQHLTQMGLGFTPMLFSCYFQKSLDYAERKGFLFPEKPF